MITPKNALTNEDPTTSLFYIKFYPHLQSHFGSRHVPLIVAKMENWFQNPRFKNGFFKFLEPCDHKHYRAGDSWSEEIGICRKVFNEVFDLIAIRYNSKSSFQAKTDPFQGKLYASYYDRKNNKMYYVRNHKFAEEFFKSLFHKKTPPSSKKPLKETLSRIIQKPVIDSLETCSETPIEITPKNDEKCRSRNGENFRSPIYEHKNTDITSKQHSSTQLPEPYLNLGIVEEMKIIWEQEIGPINLKALSHVLIQRLKHAIQRSFSGSLAYWKAYCRKIASSKFLMGEVPGTAFKAWIYWAIKPETIERIDVGEFTLGDRVVLSEIKDNRAKSQEVVQQSIDSQATPQRKAFYQSLLDQTGVGTYHSWFMDVVIEKVSKGVVFLEVPGSFVRSRLESHYSSVLLVAVQKAFGEFSGYRLSVSVKQSISNDLEEVGLEQEREVKEYLIEDLQALEIIKSQPTPQAQAFHQSLLAQTDNATYQGWFKDVLIGEASEGIVSLKASSNFVKSWLESRYNSVLSVAVQKSFEGVSRYHLSVVSHE